MRIKVLRNIGVQTIREFGDKGLALKPWQEGQVVDADEKLADAMLATGLGEASKAEVTKVEAPEAEAPHATTGTVDANKGKKP